MNKGKNYAVAEVITTRPPKDPTKVKSKNIKVTEDVHRRLGAMGSVSEEYGDIVERLLDFWDDHHKK